ncbi:putative MscS family protein.1 precursor [Roseivivax jejudonensis]|uniref:Putative MscS family protein.1 n=1 Tax=Roseivivax jejudonensis TaxID=1529041 RepID=A0A1X6Z5Z6_9RHOB|nr:DUF3772 domain-containing protein [Roseivivax jejudonensis]SLN41803.1 putative MscS family protein.1 precursor [Roseivivax jejudonensis]
MRALFLCLLALPLLIAGRVAAQDDSYDYRPWEETAERAEEALLEEDVSDATLNRLRARIAEYRSQFGALRDAEVARTETLRAQIDALGAPPEDGTERSEISQRREELEAQLAEARAPAVAAEEAFTRADGLIGEIDRTIRERQAQRLLSRGPPPVNPVNWPSAIDALLTSLQLSFTVPDDGWISPSERDQLISALPAIIGLVAVGLLLLARGAHWADVGIRWLRKRTRKGTGVWRFLLSLGEIFLPLTGILLVITAVETSGLVTERTLQLLYGVPVWLAILFYLRWLAEQTFSPDDDVATLPIGRPRRREARYYFAGLAIVLVLRRLIVALAELDGYDQAALAVLDFPLIVLSGLALFRLGQIFRRAEAIDDSADGPQPDGILFRIRIVRVLGRAMLLIGLAAPILSAAGYGNLAEYLLYPAVRTLVLGGTILVVLRFTGDLYALLTGRTVQESNSLVPVAMGFFLTLAALPILALVWGARTTDLTELWAVFTAGFTLGDTRISPTNMLTFVMVFVIGYALTRLLQGGLRSAVLPKTKIDLGGRNAIVSGLGYLGILLAALAAFAVAGINLSSLALVAGALSVGIGFGLQNIVQNFVSGIILLIERPIGEGDWIEVNGTHGFVKAISVRSTRIETFDMFDVIVPNGDFISGTVTNYTRGKTIGRLIVPISVAYGTDTRKVERILMSIARQHPLVLMNPEPFIYFAGYENSALNFEIRVFLVDILEILVVKTEMNHQIAERFAAEDIEIPFPQRDVWFRNAEVLRGEEDIAHRSFAGEGQRVRDMPQVARKRGPGAAGEPDG